MTFTCYHLTCSTCGMLQTGALEHSTTFLVFHRPMSQLVWTVLLPLNSEYFQFYTASKLCALLKAEELLSCLTERLILEHRRFIAGFWSADVWRCCHNGGNYYHLHQGDYVFIVGLFVSRITGQIFMKPCGRVQHGPREESRSVGKYPSYFYSSYLNVNCLQ